MVVVKVAKVAKKKPINIYLDRITIDVVENGYKVSITTKYYGRNSSLRHDDKEFVFDNWGEVSDFVKKANEFVKTFKVNKYDY